MKTDGFHACSLYPSARYFMDGFLEGLPKIITNLPYDFLKCQDGCFIKLKTITLNKHLEVPLTNETNEDGVRDFINAMDN